MTGYESKRAAAQEPVVFNTLTSLRHKKTVGPIESAMRNIASAQPAQVYQDHDDALKIAYQNGYYDGKKAAQPAQEPIKQVLDAEFNRGYKEGVRDAYAKSPQRPWVGLTDEEIDTIWKIWIGTERANKSYTLAIEATLRSKNT